MRRAHSRWRPVAPATGAVVALGTIVRVNDAATDQLALFGAPPTPAGPPLPPAGTTGTDFIEPARKPSCSRSIATLPLHEARYKGYTARRRRRPLRHRLRLRRQPAAAGRAAAGEPRAAARQARGLGRLGERRGAGRARSSPSTGPAFPLGWHRDVPDFETVVGISLAGTARMRFRRYPPVQPERATCSRSSWRRARPTVLRAEARWGWQHSVAPTPALRYSITFRTPSALGRQRGTGT